MTSHEHIRLGSAVEGGRPVDVDLDKLLRSELLIQAASGGGKSWAIRRIAEQAFQRHVPHVILDPEDEFSTLRERFDFLLVGPEGDTPADIRSAPLLARRILETGVSAVCSLFHMPWPERQAWVAAFLDALVNSPKDLWRDLLVTLDEAHKFCPEKGMGDAVSTEAVADLATLGRKRGFGAILATQRLAAFRKTVAAELKNVLIGKTVLDDDQDRAAKALGIRRRDREQFDGTIRRLPPGRFYGFGPAIADEPVLTLVGGVETTHPQPGARRAKAPPPPTSAIRKLLPRFEDLPKEASESSNGVSRSNRPGRRGPEGDEAAGLRLEVARLRREVQELRAAQTEHADLARLATAGGQVAELVLQQLERAAADVKKLSTQLAQMERGGEGRAPRRTASTPALDRVGPTRSALRSQPESVVAAAASEPPPAAVVPGPLRILRALKARGGRLTKLQVGILTGIDPKGTTLAKYLGLLGGGRMRDSEQPGPPLVARVGVDGIVLTTQGDEAAGAVAPDDFQPRTLLRLWTSKSELVGKTRDIVELVALEGELHRDDVADRLGIDPKGTTIAKYISIASGFQLLTNRRGHLKINPELALSDPRSS